MEGLPASNRIAPISAYRVHFCPLSSRTLERDVWTALLEFLLLLRLSCWITCLVRTPLQRNFAPSLINSKRAFSPSWLSTVMFSRSTTIARPPISPFPAFQALLSSATQGAISFPSRINRRSVRLSMTEILSMSFLLAHQEGQFANQTVTNISP